MSSSNVGPTVEANAAQLEQNSVSTVTPEARSPIPASIADSETSTITDDGPRPPLPPRPKNIDLLAERTKGYGNTLQIPKQRSRPKLQSHATTAVSLTDIHTHALPDGIRETYANTSKSSPSGKSIRFESFGERLRSYAGSEAGDSASIRSFAPTIRTNADGESILGDFSAIGAQSPAWRLLSSQVEKSNPFEFLPIGNEEPTADFNREFDEIPGLDSSGDNEEELLEQWRSKRKHFLILSAAGKPIYNRHGDDNLISGYIGVVQTIISFYEGMSDQLKSFTAGASRFVIMTRGPLHLVAISQLGENEAQLRVQLEALYMQILSTLTLPNLTHMFSKRPSTDLRRPLQGTESLLSALADTFTRGSPPTLLSALECLKIRKSHRLIINTTMLKSKCDTLLYGLVVAGGRLVSVIRPRSHSLHPGDLQLIFNMLFEAGGVKAGGGENWIPMCLPGFNKNGYLYMYVSFINAQDDATNDSIPEVVPRKEDQIAILLISANKESFYDLRQMRDSMVEVRIGSVAWSYPSNSDTGAGTGKEWVHVYHQGRRQARSAYAYRHCPRHTTFALSIQVSRQSPICNALLRAELHHTSFASKVCTAHFTLAETYSTRLTLLNATGSSHSTIPYTLQSTQRCLTSKSIIVSAGTLRPWPG